MITRAFLNFILILSISCTKDNNEEYATGISKDGIVGKWKLVEFTVSDGTSQLIKNDLSSKNYIVTFDSLGNVRSTDFSCLGNYTFDKNKPGNKGDKNLVVTFDKCKDNEMLPYSIKGISDARIIDYNSLMLNSETCDEPCTRLFKRLK